MLNLEKIADLRKYLLKFEYTFVEVVFLVAIFLLFYAPSQPSPKAQETGATFHGSHMDIQTNGESLQDQDNVMENNNNSIAEESGVSDDLEAIIRENGKEEDSGENDTQGQEVKGSSSSRNTMRQETPGKKSETDLNIATSGTAVAATSITTTAVSSPYNALGIAAGGSLIYLGQEELDRYFSGLRNLGAKWVRWDMDWAAIQPYSMASYNWNGADRVANTARNYGIKSLAILTRAPQWAKGKSCISGGNCPPEDPATFGVFAAAAASRYKGTIDTWEIWNEPNYSVSWYPTPSVETYAKILKMSYAKIKSANPNAIVMTGGLVMIADDGTNISPSTFMTYLYNSGCRNYFDAVALHPYSYPISPSYGADWNGWRMMVAIRQLMVSQKDGVKKIWATEYGAPTGGPGTVCGINTLKFKYGKDFMSESAQSQMAAGAAVLYKQSKAWMGPFFWYSLKDDGDDSSTPENFFGLLRYDGSQKPAYNTLKNNFSSL